MELSRGWQALSLDGDGQKIKGTVEQFPLLDSFGQRPIARNLMIALVAGACNHPNCLVLPFRMELIRLVA